MEGPGLKTEGFSLMTGPPRSSVASEQNQRTSRAAADYSSDEERFKLEKRTFQNQYAQTYFFRLQRMEPQMQEKIKEKWPDIEVTSVVNVPENKETAIIGTLYKEMKLKPSILAEYNTKDHALEQLVGKSKFTEASDSLVLEDVSVRMQLKGALLNVGELVTGVVAAFKGTAAPGGDFWVSDLFFAGLGPQSPLPPADGEDRYIAFVSGLAIGEEAGNPASLSLLVDFLTGMLGSPTDQAMASQVVRIVIAGGLMCSNEMLSSATTHTSTRQQSAAVLPVSEMDMAITELASTAPVDIMPGASDPASRSLPQQPLHHCLFPCASTFSTVSRVTNPHEFEVDGLTFLGTSGQNVDDVYKYSEQEDRLGILQAILEWGHLVPTAPDTLSSYPYATDDPFLLQRTPHVLFAGNQPQFQTRVHTGPAGQRVLLLCVPKFSETETLVLVNARTLDVHPIYFSAALP